MTVHLMRTSDYTCSRSRELTRNGETGRQQHAREAPVEATVVVTSSSLQPTLNMGRMPVMGSSVWQVDGRPVHRLIAPFARFVELESSGSIVLLLATFAAMTMANSRFAPAYEALTKFRIGGDAGELAFRWTIHDWVNDGLMAVFFLMVGLEVKRELVVGELTSVRRALLPVLAAFGGVLVPALIYFALNRSGADARGWGVPIATDIAFSLAVLALFGRRIPVGLKMFLVTLAIVDDIAGVAVIATAYTDHLRLGYLGIAAIVFVLCLMLNRLGVIRLPVYLMFGVLLWWAIHASGVHATLAGVLLALAIPSRSFIPPETLLNRGKLCLEEFAKSAEHAGVENQEARGHLHIIRDGIVLSESPLDRMQGTLHPWVSFGIMPLFAFTNAGISLSAIHGTAAVSPVFSGILLGLVLGKPAGITLFSWIAVFSGLAELPRGVTWKQLHAASWLGGIGFTISIFIAGLAFETEQQYALARIAVLAASGCAAGIGSCLLAIRPPFARHREST